MRVVNQNENKFRFQFGEQMVEPKDTLIDF